jgi:hypothetical protein
MVTKDGADEHDGANPQHGDSASTAQSDEAPPVEVLPKGTHKKQERNEMESNMYPNNDGQLSLATLLLLTGGGYGAFGRGGYGGYGPHAGAGYGRPSIADEVAVHNLKTPTTANVCEQFRDLERAVQTAAERGSDGVARVVDITRELQLQAATAQADLRAEVARCCFETQKEVLANRCANEKAICDQTHVLAAQITAGNQRILDKMCNNELAAANLRASTAENALSNAQQTNELLDKLRCCDPCANGNGGGHHRGGSNGLGATEIINIVQQTMSAMLSGNGGPPGQSGKKA